MYSDNRIYPLSFTPETLGNQFPGIVFDIPIYQRLFAWRKKQVTKLLDDLWDAYPMGQKYYLGILTIAVNHNFLDLIDGQQRMTVTALMAIAFMELEPEKCSYWNKYLANGNRLIFSARNEDTAYLSAKATGNAPEFINQHMEDAIQTIKKWCKDNAVDVAGFAGYVWQNLTLFCSYLPKEYVDNPIELNRYFEVMNSTGRQLQQHEILLVDLINGHPNSKSLSELWQKLADVHKRLVPNCDGTYDEKKLAREEYRNRLANSNAIFNDTEISDELFDTIEQIKPMALNSAISDNSDFSKEMIVSFDELLLMALDITLGTQSSRQFYNSKLLPRFEEAKLKKRGLVDKFFETLYKCRLLLDYKIVWQETDGDFDYDILTVDKDHRLEKFQSMMHVAHQGEFYRWLPKYLKWLIDNPNSSPESEILQLKNIDREIHPCVPSLGELTYNHVDRYWFWRLDYELWEHRNDDNRWLGDNQALQEVVNRYVFRANRSIEHLHPQTPTDEKSELWDSEALNSFGNLAMISASFNSLQSNESAGVKMERIHHQIETSQLQSLKMLHMWITYRNGETWTVEKATLHGNVMYAYIEQLREI